MYTSERPGARDLCTLIVRLYGAEDLYRYAPHNDVSVNYGPHIRGWSHKIIL